MWFNKRRLNPFIINVFVFAAQFTISLVRKKSQFGIIYAFKYKLLIAVLEIIYPAKIFPKTISKIKTNIISRNTRVQDYF